VCVCVCVCVCVRGGFGPRSILVGIPLGDALMNIIILLRIRGIYQGILGGTWVILLFFEVGVIPQGVLVESGGIPRGDPLEGIPWGIPQWPPPGGSPGGILWGITLGVHYAWKAHLPNLVQSSFQRMVTVDLGAVFFMMG
jgi:hypothetical protein